MCVNAFFLENYCINFQIGGEICNPLGKKIPILLRSPAAIYGQKMVTIVVSIAIFFRLIFISIVGL